jgi:MFS family permease
VSSGIFRFFREVDRRIKVLFVFIGVHVWDQNLPSQYKQLYATSLGANPVELGSLDSVGSIASSIISVPSGWIADRYGAKNVILIGLALTTVAAAIYSLANTWWTLIPAIVIAGASMRLVLPYVDVLFINHARPQQRSMVMSASRTLLAIPGILTPVVAAVVVTHFGGASNEAGIRPLYFIQFAMSIVVLVSLYIWLKPKAETQRDAVSEPAHQRSTFVRDFRDVFKGEKWLKRWIVVMLIRELEMRVAMPFTPLWIVGMKGADAYTLGLMGALNTLTQILLQIPAERLADRVGRKRAFYVFRSFAYLGTFLMIYAPRPEYLIAVGFLGAVGQTTQGGLGGVSFIPFITMNFEMVPQAKRGRWLGLTGFFSIICVPASIVAGVMWQQGRMIEVLLFPLLAELLIALPILTTIPDTLGRTTTREADIETS